MNKAAYCIFILSLLLVGCNADNPEATTIPDDYILPACVNSLQQQRARVVHVVDGDTINVIANGEKFAVRYLGVDTPELKADDPEPGQQAFQKNKELVDGRDVILIRDVEDKDKYDRLLRFVVLDGRLVNLDLVAEGYASTFFRPPNISCRDEFSQAMIAAYQSRLGIWEKFDSIYTQPADDICPDGCEEQQPDCEIKGNISSTAEYIFHLPGGSEYPEVKISAAKGEKWFCTIESALQNGWRPARID